MRQSMGEGRKARAPYIVRRIQSCPMFAIPQMREVTTSCLSHLPKGPGEWFLRRENAHAAGAAKSDFPKPARKRSRTERWRRLPERSVRRTEGCRRLLQRSVRRTEGGRRLLQWSARRTEGWRRLRQWPARRTERCGRLLRRSARRTARPWRLLRRWVLMTAQSGGRGESVGVTGCRPGSRPWFDGAVAEGFELEGGGEGEFAGDSGKGEAVALGGGFP